MRSIAVRFHQASQGQGHKASTLPMQEKLPIFVVTMLNVFGDEITQLVQNWAVHILLPVDPKVLCVHLYVFLCLPTFSSNLFPSINYPKDEFHVHGPK